MLCDGDTRFGCVLVGRSQHYALRETLDMQQFTPNEMAKLDIPKTGEYLPHNEQVDTSKSSSFLFLIFPCSQSGMELF